MLLFNAMPGVLLFFGFSTINLKKIRQRKSQNNTAPCLTDPRENHVAGTGGLESWSFELGSPVRTGRFRLPGLPSNQPRRGSDAKRRWVGGVFFFLLLWYPFEASVPLMFSFFRSSKKWRSFQGRLAVNCTLFCFRGARFGWFQNGGGSWTLKKRDAHRYGSN